MWLSLARFKQIIFCLNMCLGSDTLGGLPVWLKTFFYVVIFTVLDSTGTLWIIMISSFTSLPEEL